MKTLQNKNIVLAITGSIAAYKAPELLRTLIKKGAKVRIILSASGAEFVSSLTLETLSQHPVTQSMWDEQAAQMKHIKLAKWADAILIAPASANTLAGLANGEAASLLGACVLASAAPVFIAPSLNQQMLATAVTQNNLKKLKALDMNLISPDFGEQACGDIGIGNLPNADEIAHALEQHFLNGSLAQKRVLITVGATREYIDPIRFISNGSSGKMGISLAYKALGEGAIVTLVYGFITEPLPAQCQVIHAPTSNEMYEQTLKQLTNQDIFIATAAVSDYRAKSFSSQKIKRQQENYQLDLVPTPDILKEAANRLPRLIKIGFAAESEMLIENAKLKLRTKGCDAIVANDISRKDIGIDADTNEVYFITRDECTKINLADKQKIASEIWTKINNTFLKNKKKNV